MILSTQQAGFKNHSTGISALVIQAFKQQIYPSICTSCLVGTTDYFNKTTCLVIKCLSLFAHSSILQFKIMEKYNSRFFQTIEKNRKKKNFFPISKDIAVHHVKLLLATILLTTTDVTKYLHSCLE